MKFIYLKDKSNDEKLIRAVAELLEKKYRRPIEICAYKDSRELALVDLKGNPTDLIVTFNLAGFDISTLTDGLSYNLVDSKFIHFLLHENLPNEKYLSKQLSISMFFYCVGNEYCDYLWKTYPEIPWLKELTGWNAEETQNTESNVACIVSAIEEVIRECRL
ncbi:MAG: hypothetical protein IKL22_05825 [Lachnospiraceae bacterium]|nr:hypothetical protein [Lachnospiraceae bacterium]